MFCAKRWVVMKKPFLFDFIWKLRTFSTWVAWKCLKHVFNLFLFSQNLDGEMFFNTMMISVIQLIMYLLASTLINTLGNRVMLGLCFFSLISMEGSLLWNHCSLRAFHRRYEYALLELCQGCNLNAFSLGGIYYTFKHLFDYTCELCGFAVSNIDKVKFQMQNVTGDTNNIYCDAFLYRTMNVSMAMMFGRLGAIIGNLLFPLLLSLGCLPAFSMIGGFALGER